MHPTTRKSFSLLFFKKEALLLLVKRGKKTCADKKV